MTLEPKTRLGHYEIRCTLGKGGMGEVYLALDTSKLDRMVAIKVLAAEIALDPKRMQRFDQEARAVSSLNHPNILTVYESGQVDSMRFIAMEYVDGVNLREYLVEAAPLGGQDTHVNALRLKLHDVLEIAIQIAAALDAAHEANVVHRDIKPDNIMIRRRDSIVKVIDFGLAKLVEKPVSTQTGTTVQMLTQPGTVLGTVSYMSPEQTVGSNKVDYRSDIWSLGAILYEMITGRMPFEGKDIHRQIIAIQESDQSSLAKYAQGVPERLEEIVAKALAKKPDERYQSAKDLLIDLRNLSRKLDVDAEINRTQRPEPHTRMASDHNQSSLTSIAESGKAAARAGSSRIDRSASTIKQHKLLVGIVGIVFLVAAVGIYFLTRSQSVQTEPPPPVQTIKQNPLTRTGKVTRACISPEGKYVAYVSADAGKERLMLLNKENGSESELVEPAEQHYWGMTFSNDGNYVYYLTRIGNEAQGWLYRVPVPKGKVEKLIFDVDSPVTFSPDGRKMAFVRWYPRATSALWIANADGTKPELLATSDKSETFNGVPAWSPDGKLVACPIWYREPGYGTVIGIRVSDREQVKFTRAHWNDVGRVTWFSDDRLIIVAGEPNSGNQIWYLSYPNGEAQQITSGFDEYTDVSLTKDSSALVTVQSREHSNVRLAPAEKADRSIQITNGTGIDGNKVSWTTDGRILYDSQAKGNLDVWVVNPDGSNPQRLTSDSQADFFPSASLDGLYIIFVSNRSGTNHVWRMDSGGSNETQLSFGDTYEKSPILTSDGRWVICELEGAAGLWKIPITGGVPEQLVSDLAFRPAAYPKGENIAYWIWNGPEGTSARDVSLGFMNFPGGTQDKPPIKMPSTINAEVNLQWSLDGKAILYVDRSNGVSNIWAQPIDGGKRQQKTFFTTDSIFSFAYSPDGTQIALAQGTIMGDVVLMTNLKR